MLRALYESIASYLIFQLIGWNEKEIEAIYLFTHFSTFFSQLYILNDRELILSLSIYSKQLFTKPVIIHTLITSFIFELMLQNELTIVENDLMFSSVIQILLQHKLYLLWFSYNITKITNIFFCKHIYDIEEFCHFRTVLVDKVPLYKKKLYMKKEIFTLWKYWTRKMKK